jgi:caa(3)-type oxidase subunit IV
MASKGHSNGIHVFPISMYGKTLLALIILMGLTIWASMWHIPNMPVGPITINGSLLSNLLAMTIAVIKGMLVIQFFMHVKFGTDLIKLWALTGFVWVTLMLFILMDYATRKYEPAPAFEADPGSALYREITRTGEHPPKDDYPVVRPR